MACTVGGIAAIMERWAPASLAEEDDNVGLLAGTSGRAVDSVLIALDVNEAVVEHARQSGAGMIIAHHPFIYRPLAAVTDGTQAGRLAIMAIEAGIAIYASHTNLDRAAGGVNDALCDTVGLINTVPYAEGSIGRMANTREGITLDNFARHAKTVLGAPVIRITGDAGRLINSVFVISGAGRHYILDAVNAGADCMLTGEIGYHDGHDALASGMCIVEAGHYYSEKPILYKIEKHLQIEFQRLKYTVRTEVYKKSTCPFHHIG